MARIRLPARRVLLPYTRPTLRQLPTESLNHNAAPKEVAAMSSESSQTSTPHAAIGGQDAQQRLALDLFDRLWQRYRTR